MGWVDLFATFYPPNTFHWCPLMGGMFDPKMPKLTKRHFPTSSFFGNTYCRFLVTRQEIAVLWSLNCSRHKYILHLHKIRNWFATEMQNRCRVQIFPQINIFLLKKEHLSATNQSSSCNYSFWLQIFFLSKSASVFFIFQEVHLSLTNWTFGCTHQPVLSKIGKIAMSKSWKQIHFSFLDKYMCSLTNIYIFLQRHIFSQNKYMFFSGQYITLDICQEE